MATNPHRLANRQPLTISDARKVLGNWTNCRFVMSITLIAGSDDCPKYLRAQFLAVLPRMLALDVSGKISLIG